MSDSPIPSTKSLQDAILRALRRAGGSASNEALGKEVAREEGVSPEALALVHSARGHRTEFEYRMAWARTQLKLAGAIESAGRMQWKIKPS